MSSDHQDAIAAAMNRRIQDSSIRAARLLALHNDERQHLADLQDDYTAYMNRRVVTIVDDGEDG